MGLGDKAKPFPVEIMKKEVVAPLRSSTLLQEHWLPMSNLDLLFPSQLKFAVVLCYKNPTLGPQASENGDSFISSLKKSLAQVLVPFYPLAGEVVQNSVGEPEIWCNNRGVEFIEAYADIELKKLNLYNLDESFVAGKLVPENKHDILVVQLTKLKCGSVIVVCLFDHRISDGYSASLFMVSWAKFVRSRPLSYNNHPSFRRSLLNPRRFGYIDTSVHDMYGNLVTTPENTSPSLLDDDPFIISNRLYYIKAEHIKHLQTLASLNNNNNVTKLETFSAFLWKLIAKHSSSSDNKEKLCRVAIVVDGRKLLAGDGREDNVMNNYFGNVLSCPFWDKKVSDLNREPLDQVAKQVHECLETVAMKEHFLGMVDWVESLRPKSGIFGLSSYKMDDERSIIVSSGLRFSIVEVDFGWGRPILGTFQFPMGMRTMTKGGYVLPILIPIGNGDWVVYMHLHTSQLEFIEKEASNFLKPLTFDYLSSRVEQHMDQRSRLRPYQKKECININSKI
ncbi:coniferyl alcohol acyltransferase-like [Humulus lupulus]|uniref:coniferyl alcohol acyltransferase-like n=1 Tax=Humulus lupulus TaxID=3486 RepID=UPI002B411F11|nr:coniferyl alcohol acyltransferase-like [Humulus lupulus]